MPARLHDLHHLPQSRPTALLAMTDTRAFIASISLTSCPIDCERHTHLRAATTEPSET